MTRLSIILCEKSPRWAPALRVAFARASPRLECKITYREVPGLPDLDRAVQQSPNSLLGIEIDGSSLGDIISTVPKVLERYPQSRAVGLLNRADIAAGADLEIQMIPALHEAGFLEVAISPRQLDAVVETCRRFAEQETVRSKNSSGNRSYCEQVWNALPWQPPLPWQPTPPPVG